MIKLKLKVHNQVISAISNVKYLGVYQDQNLNYQIEIKNILRKMALGIKSLYPVRDIFPQKTRKLLLNALVVSHLHYSAILLSGISENLLTTLEKGKLGNKSQTSTGNEMPTSTANEKKNKKPPAFAGKMKFPTGDIRSHKRTKKVYFNIQCKTDSLKKSFFNKTVPIWNELPKKLKIGKCTYITTKKYQTILLKQICKRKRQFRIWKKMLE